MLKQVSTLCLGITFFSIYNIGYADSNPCIGKNAFINIIDRPNNADSACVVPFKHFDLESGYDYQKIAPGTGYSHDFPQSELRIGLPLQSEVFFVLPIYNYQFSPKNSGFSNSTLGLKHQVGYNDKWMLTAEGAFEFPGGSKDFGTQALGGFVSAIINYAINDKFTFTFVVGGSIEADPINAGGHHYNSFNPDAVLSYSVTEKWSLYGEIYGQTKTGANENSGFNADVGLLYLVHPNVVIDISAGQRLRGYLYNIEHYFGAGISFLV
ncbi:transporter [Legionella gresilensis]|uniref:transporter n=1 Tax=Legionella gresilensis TaxID=91823 RepID=UPI001040FA2A|nr:transporter [Legionella gresilensis]